MNINGKTYRKFEKHTIYCLSKVIRSSVDSLVHRLSNGDAHVNDVRVLSEHPDRTVDIRSIANHEITAIMLIIAGRSESTTAGEVILIMHQHAHHIKNKIIHSSPQT